MSFNLDFFIETFWLCLKSVPVTLQIVAVSLLLALPAALLFAIVRSNQVPFFNVLVKGYVVVFRGVPVVIQILVVYSIVPSILAALLKSWGSSIDIYAVNPIIYAYIVFTLYNIAVLTEICRSSLLTVSKDQLEAAQAVGLNQWQAYRRIIIPQALVSALPNLCTMITGLIKATSLAFLMTVKEITSTAKVAAAFGYNYIEAYLDIWIIYLMLCLVTEALFKYWEKRARHYKRLPL